jgi:hypothetical protein
MDEQSFNIGTPLVVESKSISQDYGVVFEDDGETGYFYALDFSREDNPIVDAMHIYNAGPTPGAPQSLLITWSSDGLKVGLVLSEKLHAVFDFEERRGYCRTGFPASDPAWTRYDHSWSDSAADLLR